MAHDTGDKGGERTEFPDPTPVGENPHVAEKDKSGKPHPEKLTLIFVINGVEVSVDAESLAPLGSARNKALAVSQNTGRPPNEWEIRNEKGELLSPERKIEEFQFSDRVILFLTLKIAAGGRDAGRRRCRP